MLMIPKQVFTLNSAIYFFDEFRKKNLHYTEIINPMLRYCVSP